VNAGGIGVDFNNMFTVMVKALLMSCGRLVKADCGHREIRFRSGELGEEK